MKSRVPDTSRREFCVHACQAASLAAFAAILDACSGSPSGPSGNATELPTIAGTNSAGTVTVSIASGSPLASVGGAALVQASGVNLLVSRTGQDTFVALSAVCTHQGCTVTGIQNSTYVCPCHGAGFTTSGAVVAGPATRALQAYATTFANNVLSIRIA